MRVSGLGFRVLGLGLRVEGLGLRVLGFQGEPGKIVNKQG